MSPSTGDIIDPTDDYGRPRRIPLPPLRAWQVTRLAWTDDYERELRTETVVAHQIQYTGRGQVLLFSDFRYVTRYDQSLRPVETIQPEVHRVINGYEDVVEVAAPSTPGPSLPQ